ncbi:hypothetical protein GCM10009600_06190 [Oerskovia paurometabola]
MGFETEVAYRQQQVRADYDHHENVLMHWLRSHRLGHKTHSTHASTTGQTG